MKRIQRGRMRLVVWSLIGWQPGCGLMTDETPIYTGPPDETCKLSNESTWPESWAALECDLLRLTNQARAAGADCGANGIFGPAPALRMQANLRTAARLHSQWMAQTGIFSHESPGGPNGDTFQTRITQAGYSGWRLIGENIAAGQPTAARVMQDWLGSPGHCANLLNPGFVEIGIGLAQANGGQQKPYWTQDFGAR